MGSRLDLNTLLKTIVPNVYYQPPESVKLKYPCIIYQLSRVDVKYANNQKYKDKKAYQLILVGHPPDSPYFDTVHTLPLCAFDRHYTSDNLNHDVFTLYY